MDKETYHALSQIVEAIKVDKDDLVKVVQHLKEAFKSRDEQLAKLTLEVEDLKKGIAELILVNGANNGNKTV